jgi:hypothetical protein
LLTCGRSSAHFSDVAERRQAPASRQHESTSQLMLLMRFCQYFLVFLASAITRKILVMKQPTRAHVCACARAARHQSAGRSHRAPLRDPHAIAGLEPRRLRQLDQTADLTRAQILGDAVRNVLRLEAGGDHTIEGTPQRLDAVRRAQIREEVGLIPSQRETVQGEILARDRNLRAAPERDQSRPLTSIGTSHLRMIVQL